MRNKPVSNPNQQHKSSNSFKRKQQCIHPSKIDFHKSNFFAIVIFVEHDKMLFSLVSTDELFMEPLAKN